MLALSGYTRASVGRITSKAWAGQDGAEAQGRTASKVVGSTGRVVCSSRDGPAQLSRDCRQRPRVSESWLQLRDRKGERS